MDRPGTFVVRIQVMFEEITEKRTGERTARSAMYLAASAVFQLLLLLALVFIGDRLRVAATGGAPLIAVKLIRPSPQPAAVPPPPPPPPAPRPQPAPRPRSAPPSSRPLPTALVQPKEVPIRPPSPSMAPEPVTASTSSGPDDRTDGVEGGNMGGVVGGTVGSQGLPGGTGPEDGPVYPGSGARKPGPANPLCLRDSLRLPKDLQGFVSGPVDVRFAVQTDGSITDFRVLTALPDPRIAEAISKAMSSCRWIAGADIQGRPAWFWSTMRLRFEGG